MQKLIPILLIIAFIQSCSFSQTDTAQITENFNSFKDAIRDNNGDIAIKYLNKNTLAYYSELLNKIKTLDSLQLEKELLINKFLILKFRYIASRQEILSMNERDLIIFSINKGLSGYSSFLKNTLGKITITGDSAKAERISKNGITPFIFSFRKEEGIWKLYSIPSSDNSIFKQLAIDSQKSENDFLFGLLENISDKHPGTDLWKPIK